MITVDYVDGGVGAGSINFVVDNNLHNYSWANVVDADITDTLTASDLAIGSQATGDVLFFDGANWDRLAKGNDDEVLTACQQACPADAITFGNINDPLSHVAILKSQKRNYKVLDELNIKPRTSYLAKIRNPNPPL